MTRDELYAAVWSEPMSKLAPQYGVSGSYLARICELLNVPRPERGYWAKLAVGKAPQVPSLPEHRPGDPLDWCKEGARTSVRPQAPARRKKQDRPVKIARGRTHRLIREGRPLFEKGYPIDEGAYLKPYKKLMADVTSSKSCLDKALSLTSDLYNAFESVGHRVVLAAADSDLHRDRVDERVAGGPARAYWEHRDLWSPLRPTVVYIGTVAFGLAVIEMSEHVTLRYLNGKYVRDTAALAAASHFDLHRSWTTTKDIPSGRLRVIAYAPYGRITWSRQRQDTYTRSVRSSLKAIVEDLESAAPAIVIMLEEAELQAEKERREREAQHQRWLREEDRRQVDQSVSQSKKDLAEVITRWSEVMQIEQFFASVEVRAQSLGEAEHAILLERLRLAREFLGSQDPLDFFRSWRSPGELYRPRYDGNDLAGNQGG